MSDETTTKQPEYTDAEIDRIAKEVAGAAEPEPEEISNLSFDLNDEELVKVTQALEQLYHKWRFASFDLASQFNFRREAEDRMAELGFIITVGWIPESIQNPRNHHDTIMVYKPDITFIDRVGGLQVETDYERKKWDVRQNHRIEDVVGEQLKPVAEKLLD